MVGPHAHTLVVVVGETGWALVSRRLAVPARVEDAAVTRVGEDAVEAWAVRSADWRFQVRSVAALDREGVGTVLALVVRVIEHQSIAAGLQGGGACLFRGYKDIVQSMPTCPPQQQCLPLSQAQYLSQLLT